MRDWRFWSLAVLLFLLPFNRGLFFYRELQIFHALFACLFLAYWWLDYDRGRKEKDYLTLIDVGATLIMVGYIVSAFFAVNLRDAVGEVFKHVNYLLVYFMVSRGIRQLVQVRQLIYSIYLSGVLVAILGLGAAFKTFAINGAFEAETGRILSTLQYANTNAIYLTVCLVLGLFLALSAQGLREKLILSGLNSVLFLTFMGTQSRGGLLVLGFILLLMIFGTPKHGFRTLASVLTLIISVLPFLGRVYITDMNASGWMYVGGVMVVAGLVAYLQDRLERHKVFTHVQTREKLLIPLLGLLFVVVLFSIFTFGKGLLPATIANRIEKIDFEQHSVVERGYFYKDATKIIREHPITGLGGGAWEGLYKKYQSYYYISTRIHNHYLQAWLEGGVLALVGWATVIGASLYIFVRNRFGKLADSTLEVQSWFIFLATSALMIHSLIDFNLSFGSLSIILWTLIGLATATGQGATSLLQYNLIGYRNVIGMPISLVLLVYLGFSLAMSFSETLVSKGVVALQQENNVVKAVELYESAVKLNPLEADYKEDLAQFKYAIADKQNNDAGREEAVELIKAAMQLDKGNPKHMFVAGRIMLDNGKVDEGISYLENAKEHSPWDQKYYEYLSEIYVKAGLAYMKAGKTDKAKKYFRQAIELPKEIDQRIASLDAEKRRLWRGPILQVDEKIKKNTDTARGLI